MYGDILYVCYLHSTKTATDFLFPPVLETLRKRKTPNKKNKRNLLFIVFTSLLWVLNLGLSISPVGEYFCTLLSSVLPMVVVGANYLNKTQHSRTFHRCFVFVFHRRTLWNHSLLSSFPHQNIQIVRMFKCWVQRRTNQILEAPFQIWWDVLKLCPVTKVCLGPVCSSSFVLYNILWLISPHRARWACCV